jgi:FkbM family methyltransferase
MLEINNLRFEIRESSHDEYVLGDEILRDVYEIGEPDVLVDIGAHIGGTALRAAYYGAKVYAFEPSKENYNLLKKNIKLNGLEDKIKARRVAVGTPGTRKLYHHPSNFGCFSFNKDNTTFMTDDFEEVKTISIKDAFMGIKHCDILKIDCEGGETEFYKDIPFEKIDQISMELHGRAEDEDIVKTLSEHYRVERKKDLLICKK